MIRIMSYLHTKPSALVLCLLIAISCQDQASIRLEYDRFGNISRKTEYHLSDYDSLVSEYYPNTQLKSILNYKNGKLQGIGKFYYESGKSKQISKYMDNLLNGKDSSFNESGALTSVVEYAQGKKSGKFYKYFPDGRIKFEAEYKEDTLISVNGLVIPDQE